MSLFQDTYDMRIKEIKDIIELMEFLEEKERSKGDEESEFSRFFHADEDGMTMTFQELINILKSNVSLMIYNLIEYTLTSLIDSIYDEIRENNLSYIDVNKSIRDLWRQNILRSANDPNASFNTFLRKNDEIIDAILNNHVLNMDARHTLPAGNLDWESIQKTLASHEISVELGEGHFRPDILSNIKENRNNLAHGEVSFVDAVRDDTIADVRNSMEFVVVFLEKLIDMVNNYIKDEKYKFA